MKKFLMLILMLSVVPAVVASNCTACCPVDDSCCPKVCESSCQPNGCCPDDCEELDPCDCRVSAHSFFRVRPQFQGASPEKRSFWGMDRMYARIDGKHGAFQVVPFGGRSGEARRLASYFMPFCKAELLVQGGGDPDTADRDIDARVFNIHTTDVNVNFKSRICFRPQQSVAGVGLNWRQKLSRNDEEKGFWFEASMPIVRVRNAVKLSETVLESGGSVDTTDYPTAQANMTSAFQQAAFNFGRVPCNCNDGLSKTGVADLDLRIGYGWMGDAICNMESYLGVLIPTGNKVTGCNIFEPIVGHNHHVGFEFGSSFAYQVWINEEKERALWIETSIHSIYFDKNTQRRSFDVKYSPWSRYLPVYTSFAQAQAANTASMTNKGYTLYTPGINVFTQDVKVHGRFQRTLNTAIAYQSSHFMAEGGYNFFVRDAECVELCNWCNTVAFLADSSVDSASTGDAIGATNRFRSINKQNTDNDKVFLADGSNYNATVIKQEDLDLSSAAAPAQMQHTFYGTVGYRWDDREYPLFVSLGGSYEFASDNSGMDRWLVWGKIGMSY